MDLNLERSLMHDVFYPSTNACVLPAGQPYPNEEAD